MGLVRVQFIVHLREEQRTANQQLSMRLKMFRIIKKKIQKVKNTVKSKLVELSEKVNNNNSFEPLGYEWDFEDNPIYSGSRLKFIDIIVPQPEAWGVDYDDYMQIYNKLGYNCTVLSVDIFGPSPFVGTFVTVQFDDGFVLDSVSTVLFAPARAEIIKLESYINDY